MLLIFDYILLELLLCLLPDWCIAMMRGTSWKENIVLYSCTNYRHAQSEKSILWNDKDLKIKWGIKKPIISKKDRSAQKFKDIKF